jgi:hypothetical protein
MTRKTATGLVGVAPPADPNALVDIAFAQGYLSVSRSTVYQMMDSETLPFVLLPGTGDSPRMRRIKFGDLLALVEKGRLLAIKRARSNDDPASN